MPLDSFQGAWRIEESPNRRGRPHPYGGRNTHWVIVGDRGIVFRDRIPRPLRFDFRLAVHDTVAPSECGILGKHGGSGYYENDGDLLFVALGIQGGRPPRFASDCGDFFAFIRDHEFSLPEIPVWPRTDIASDFVGRLVWEGRDPEYMGGWKGAVDLPDETHCEILVSDYLVPINQFLQRIEDVYEWLKVNLTLIKHLCAERVGEWLDEDDEYCDMTEQQIANTIRVSTIDASNGDVHLWAATSIPIDHVIRVWLEIDQRAIRATGASIEG